MTVGTVFSDTYLFSSVVASLAQKSGSGTELISVYIPATKPVSSVVAHLRAEYAQCANIKSKATRTSVQAAIRSILARLATIDVSPNGVAIFCGTVVTGTRAKLECIVVDPIDVVPSYLYRCGSAFEVQPLQAMLAEKPIYGLLVIDASDAAIGILCGNRIESVTELTSTVPRKHSQGGQSAARFERLREIAINEFFKKVADAANDRFLGIEEFHKRFRGLIVGGLSPTKEAFLKRDHLHHELRNRTVGVVDVCYTTEYGLRELVHASQDLLADVESVQKKRILDRFLRELATSGRAAYGIDDVRARLMTGSVDTLLVSTRCDVSIVDDLVSVAQRFRTEVVMVPDDFDEGLTFAQVFGGVGVILRY